MRVEQLGEPELAILGAVHGDEPCGGTIWNWWESTHTRGLVPYGECEECGKTFTPPEREMR